MIQGPSFFIGVPMWSLTVPWYEYVIRGVMIYFCLFFLSRFVSKKHFSRFGSYDLILIIAVTEILLNGFTQHDQNIPGALIIIGTLIALNTLYSQLLVRFTWFENLIFGRPVVIILNGKLFKKVMKEQRISESELLETLREHEIMNPDDVKCAILETDGNISVIKYSH